MFSYFPQVRDEESTYSIFSRLQFALQPLNLTMMGTVFFNNKYEVGRLNFQSSFDYLCSNLPSKFTSEIFFHNNTIFPLFIPFLTTENQKKALKYFKGIYPGKINQSLASNKINRGKRFIRICKECIKEDFNTYGEPYYRRQHEIELNRMCYKHKIPLYEYTILNYEIPRRYEDYFTVLGNCKEIFIPKKFKNKFLDIAEDINTIFTLNLYNWNIEITKDKISNKIAEKGYVTLGGSTLQQKLGDDLKKYHTEEFLSYIGYNFDVADDDNWVRYTSRKKIISDPLKFILVIQFLFSNFKEFYLYNKKFSIFKQGPYPCLNKVCPNYNNLVIKDILKITMLNGYPMATFKCEYCGFEYSRKGPDMHFNDIYNKTYIKDFGHLWHIKLKECVDNNFSINKMARILGYNNLNVINSWVQKYKSSNWSEIPAIKFKNESNILLLEWCKNEILKIMKEHPNIDRNNICRLNQRAYKYLLSNDNNWLYNTVPPSTRKKSILKKEKSHNYWLSKDELVSKELLKAINRIKSEKKPYKRLTIFILQKYISYYNLKKNKNNLPKCFEIIDKECETIADYQKRRVNYVIKELCDCDIKLTTSQVLYKAHLGTLKNLNQEVLNYTEKMVSEYNSTSINIIKKQL